MDSVPVSAGILFRDRQKTHGSPIEREIWRIRIGDIDEETNPKLLAHVIQAYDEDEHWFVEKQIKKKSKQNSAKFKQKGVLRRIIDKKLQITKVAQKYGLKVKGTKAVCPFHTDKDPSLSFNDDMNVFYCFGCGKSGDIIEFIRSMEELKNDNKG